MQKNEILDLLYRRYSCRKFDPTKKIPEQDFEPIIQAGRFAPSSLGLEPWKFIIITSQPLKEEIAKDSSGGKHQIQDCSHLLIVCHLTSEVLRADSNYLASLYEDKETHRAYNKADLALALESIRNHRLKGDDKLINAYAREQCFIAIGQMTQTAALLDIDSCIIGGFYATGVKMILNKLMSIDGLEPACLIAFGYGIEHKIPPKYRKSSENALHWFE
ncbi:NAD(P)H-dependent oxidoreductase [Helicobacter sp. 11S02596-1]|uniref:NAD(P)H-dependent oxidoreductase n=1 Tax=Helicobacter sp. 11S02596-1 TaxID=1476194 RepID=UPI000BA5DE33|nr:NAD(P)H-dependent oxidoreductase [Helicobacter sp. 11S02596-1]PAF42505.1 hypothetical protein BJI48_06820 [Helicobacter sp. 11S02596-1]